MEYIASLESGLKQVSTAGATGQRDINGVAGPLTGAASSIGEGADALARLPGMPKGFAQKTGRLVRAISAAMKQVGKLLTKYDQALRAVKNAQAAIAKVGKQLDRVKKLYAKLTGKDAAAASVKPVVKSSSVLGTKAKRLRAQSLPDATAKRPHLLILLADKGERFYFGLSTAAFDTLKRQASFNVGVQERLGRPEALQAVSQGSESITLSGVVFASLAGIGQIKRLRQIGLAMNPLELVTGYGETLGRWYLTSISEDQANLLADGVPRRQDFTVEFKRYGDDSQNL